MASLRHFSLRESRQVRRAYLTQETLMDSLLIALVMGVVEGLTEFLPVSSTGHLIIVGHLLGYTGANAAIFEVVIQLGGILAIVLLYRRRFLELIPPIMIPIYQWQTGFSGWSGLWLLFLTSSPASLLGLVTHKSIKYYLFNPLRIAIAMATGAVAMLLIEALPRRKCIKNMDEITPILALGIGIFQCLSLWPGFSRAGATIIGAMALGIDRRIAVEYSFLSAMPLLAAATVYDLYKSWNYLDNSQFSIIAVGLIASFGTAWIVVKSFINLLSRITLRPFAWYRLVFALVVWMLWR